MYLRLVQVKVKADRRGDHHRLYDEEVIPVLQKIRGCLFASLMESEHHPEECISMTLWNSREQAEEYVRSGVFQDLMRRAAPFLADSSEWKISLSEDLTLQYEPVPQEPVIKSYEVTAAENAEVPARKDSAPLFVRIVSPRIRGEKLREFKRIYVEEVLPALRNVKGCRYAYLTENVPETNRIISVTIWDSRQDAEAYERGGMFNALKAKLEHTFAEVYQWKMQLEKGSGGQVVTSEEMTVDGYRVISGKGFR